MWRILLEPTGAISFYVFWFVPMLMVLMLSLASFHWFETPAANWMNNTFGQSDTRTRRAKKASGTARLEVESR